MSEIKRWASSSREWARRIDYRAAGGWRQWTALVSGHLRANNHAKRRGLRIELEDRPDHLRERKSGRPLLQAHRLWRGRTGLKIALGVSDDYDLMDVFDRLSTGRAAHDDLRADRLVSGLTSCPMFVRHGAGILKRISSRSRQYGSCGLLGPHSA